MTVAVSGIAGGLVAAAQSEFTRKLQEAQTAMMKQHAESMMYKGPKPDALCGSWTHTDEECCSCNGTNRDPIPWREVMSV